MERSLSDKGVLPRHPLLASLRISSVTPAQSGHNLLFLQSGLSQIADVRRFSGLSARKGGLTTAISAGVTEEIMFLQSGHSQSRAARNYRT